MQVGLLTDGLDDWSLSDILDWIPKRAPQIVALELGTGGYSSAPHCDRAALLANESQARALQDRIAERGLELAALNVSGNPLHPDPEIGASHDRALRETLELAAFANTVMLRYLIMNDSGLRGGHFSEMIPAA